MFRIFSLDMFGLPPVRDYVSYMGQYGCLDGSVFAEEHYENCR